MLRRRRNKKAIGNALAILDSNAGQLSETARVLKLPKSTLKSWRDNYASDEAVARYRTIKNAELADGFRAISALAIERLIAEIDSVDVNKLATVAAIGADKQLLLSASPAAVTETVGSEEVAAILEMMLNKGQLDEGRYETLAKD